MKEIGKVKYDDKVVKLCSNNTNKAEKTCKGLLTATLPHAKGLEGGRGRLRLLRYM